MRRPDHSKVFDKVVQELESGITDPKLKKMAMASLLNTWETTTFLMEDKTTYIITGDIKAMWLRDSSCQVEPYLHFADTDPYIKEVLLGLAQKQAFYLCIDPYANAFNQGATGVEQFPEDRTAKNPWVFERKFELDSICHPVRFWWTLWRRTGDRGLFTPMIHEALTQVVKVMEIEQHHKQSEYSFERQEGPLSDTLACHGLGTPVADTGMIWSGFRPSDDACMYHYLIPAQLFAAQTLLYIATIAGFIYDDQPLLHKAQQLRSAILSGVESFGKINHPEFGTIYAYEADGLGGINLMDDANVPSLLSLPYLGVCYPNDPVYLNTRRFILSRNNPYYSIGRCAKGIGSPHTPDRYIWPISLIIQGMTSVNPAEADELLRMVMATDGGTGLMHEGFNPDDPKQFTRAWFAWANALFGEWILRRLGFEPYNPLHDPELLEVSKIHQTITGGNQCEK